MNKVRVYSLLVVCLVLSSLSKAWADANPLNDLDALTLTITPNVDFGVDIATNPAHLALGAVDLGNSTFTVRPATFTILGNFSSQELVLDALVTASGGTPWTFDSSTTTAENNKLAAWVLFTSTMVYQVGTSSFTDTGYINDNTSAPATISVGDTTQFETA